MPLHDQSNATKYYVIERVGVESDQRFQKTLGHQLIINDPWDQKPSDPVFGRSDQWFKWDTYTGACHWLARWNLPGTYRVMYVEEYEDGDCDIFEWAENGPVDPERFDERDWKEFHHMNGKSN